MRVYSTYRTGAEEKEMTEFICERIPSEYRVILSQGEDGSSWADLSAYWDEATGWHLLMEQSGDHVTLEEVYDYFRRKEMSVLEFRRWFDHQHYRSKAFRLELEVATLQQQIADAPSGDLIQIGRKVNDIEELIRQHVGSERRMPDQPSDSSVSELPDCLPARTAAQLLGVDRKTLNKFRRDGLLKWRVKNPNSSRKEFLYEKESVLALATNFQIGEPATRQEPRRRQTARTYVPKHIKLE